MSSEPSPTRPRPSLDVARRVLRERFGHEDFLPGQEEAIRRVLAGEDLTIVMPTGAGKSACFQVPALAREGLTLVLSPLIALMRDQVEGLQARRIEADFVNSSIPASEQHRRLDRAAAGETKLLYVAPERLGAPSFQRALERCRVSMVAVDEAHCISQWGHDFRPAYLRIRPFLERFRTGGARPQVLALTATATPRVRRDVAEHLGIPPDRLLLTGFRRPNLRLLSRRCDRKADKLDQVLDVVRGIDGAGIVYAATRRDVEDVASALLGEGVSAVAYHAGLEDAQRSAVQDAFVAGRARIIVATNAFGMGIDKPDIRFVVHHSLPGSIEAYYQEAGRAGRDGRTSYCVLVHGSADRHLHQFFIDGSSPPEPVVLDVWDAVRRLPGEILEISVKALAEEASTPDNQCAGSLRLLEDAGLVERLDDRDNPAHVTFDRPVATLAAGAAPGTRRRELLDWLAQGPDPRPGAPLALRPSAVQDELGWPRETLFRVLRELADGDGVAFRAPFRGRGIVVPDRGVGRAAARERLRELLQRSEARRVRAEERLDRVVHYAHCRSCRHGFLLGYFGDDSADGCRACDNCCGWHAEPKTSTTGGRRRPGAGGRAAPRARAPRSVAELAEARPHALSALAALDRRFGLGVAKLVLRGSRSRKVVDSGLDDVAGYGSLARWSAEDVDALLGALQADGLLETTAGPYPVVALTEAGRFEAGRRN